MADRTSGSVAKQSDRENGQEESEAVREESLGHSLESFQEAEELRIALRATKDSTGNEDKPNEVPDSAVVELYDDTEKISLQNLSAFAKLDLGDEASDDDDDNNNDDDDDDEDTNAERRENEAITTTTTQEDRLLGRVPEAIFDNILMFLGEHFFPRCKVVSWTWNQFFKRESLYQKFCLYFFIPPAYRSIRCLRGRPRKFKSWKDAYDSRKRVKCCGWYVHKHIYHRDGGPRTMFSPPDYSKFIQVSHYRYVLFLRNGKALYASTPRAPKKVVNEFRRHVLKYYEMKQQDAIDEHYDYTESHPQGQGGDELELAGSHNFFEGGAQDSTKKKQKLIYPATYKVKDGEIVLLINLYDYSVKFHFEIDSVGCIVKTKHESIYHNAKEEPIYYPLEKYRFEREWTYKNLF